MFFQVGFFRSSYCSGLWFFGLVFFKERIFLDLVLFGSVLFRIDFLIFCFFGFGRMAVRCRGVRAMGGASGVSGCQGVREARRRTQEEEPGKGVRANLRGQGYLV